LNISGQKYETSTAKIHVKCWLSLLYISSQFGAIHSSNVRRNMKRQNH